MTWNHELLRRFREGDRAAVSQVFRDHVQLLTRRVRRVALRGGAWMSALHSASELENVVLEVFARAFEPAARLRYDGIRPYENFLLGIARNVLLEQSRSRELPSGIWEDLERELDSSNEPPAQTTDERMEDHELSALIADFRGALSQPDARLFDLRFVQQRAQEDAARELGITRIQLRRRERTLRQQLLARLQRSGYLEGMQMQGWSLVPKGRAE